MKKTYTNPTTTFFALASETTLLSVSDSNLISGTIHSGSTGETIGAGKEEDDEGMEASAKFHEVDPEWQP